jgi:hypothetical protein
VLALAVVGSTSLHGDTSAAEILGALTATHVAFYLVDCYAHTLPRLTGKNAWHTEAAIVMRREWPVLGSAVPPALCLLAAVVGLISRDTAVTLAIVLGLVDLFGAGMTVGRHAGQALPRALLSGVLALAVGLVMVALKSVPH